MTVSLSESDLHALIDGRLPAAEASLFERQIRQDRELSSRVETWRRQSASLSAAFGPIADEPLPMEFLGFGGETRPVSRAAWFFFGALVGLGCGLAIGWSLALASLR
jgi:anti-sigma factor RsiW